MKYLPDFDFEFITLHGFDFHKIKGIIYLRVALLIMKYYFLDELEEKLTEILSLLRGMEDTDSFLDFLELVLRYLTTNKKYDEEWLKIELKKTYKEKGEKIMNSIADIWINRGKNEGLLEDAREMVIDALKVKYNNVSKTISNVITNIKDRNLLRNLHRDAIISQDINDFQNRLMLVTSIEA